MTSVLDETLKILKEARERSDSVLVSFSGGKDSLVVLDLCSRTFSRVECFFMQWVPGIVSAEAPAVAGAERYGVKLHMVPHWGALRCMKFGVFCFNGPERDGWPDVKLRDIYAMMIDDTGIPLIAMGGKRRDSLWRKRNLDSTKRWTEVITPIVGWSNHEVASHLVSRRIPIPKSERRDASGIDVSRTSILWLYDNHPDDYAILEQNFEFVGAVVEQRRLYGGEKTSK